MKARKLFLVVLLALPLLLVACFTPTPTPTGTDSDAPPSGVTAIAQQATYTPVPTYTPPPTYTPMPTYTPVATYTPKPTFTPLVQEPSPTLRPTRATKTPTKTLAPTPSDPVEPSDLEQAMFEAINAERTKAGQAALVVDPVLAELARGHAQAMIDEDFTGHVNPDGQTYKDRLETRGIEVRWSGENWFSGNSAEDEIVQEAMRWFMDDPPHQANIVHPFYRRVGIGIVSDSGSYYVVQDFTEDW